MKKEVFNRVSNFAIKIFTILIPVLIGITVLVRFLTPFGLNVKYDFNIADNAELFGKIRDIDRSSEVQITDTGLNIKDKFDITKENVEFTISPISRDFKTINFNIGLDQIDVSTLMLQVTNFNSKSSDNYVIYNRDLSGFGNPDYQYKEFSVWSFNPDYKTLLSLENKIGLFNQSSDSISTCTLGNSFSIEPQIYSAISLSNPKTYSHALRGTHNFSVYVGVDGILYFGFDKQDLNWYAGIDEANIKVLKNDAILKNEIIQDDGIYDGKFGRPLGSSYKYVIEMNDLKEGVYQVNIETNEDVLLENITTRNPKVVVDKDIFLANNQIYGVGTTETSISTYASRLFISSYHDTGTQKVYVNGELKSLENIQDFESFELSNKSINTIKFTESDVRISSKDFYALDDDSYFRPTIVDEINCLSYPKDVIQKQDLLVVKNLSRQNVDGTYTVSIPYSSNIVSPDNQIIFNIYSPGLGTDESKFEIKSLSIEMIK